MKKKKGMSQTLSLIVAATVMLMAALTVIFLTSNSLGDFGSSSRGQGCTQTLQATCQAQGGQGYVRLPGSCVTDGSPTQALKDYTGQSSTSGSYYKVSEMNYSCGGNGF